MLALTRKKDQAIIIGGDIEIKVLSIQGDKVKIGITAPKECSIYREEVYKIISDNNQASIQTVEVHLSELENILKK